MNYKLTDDEYDTLRRYSDANLLYADIARMFELKMNAFMKTVILPKMKLIQAPNTAVSLKVDWKTREIAVGYEKAGAAIAVPGSNGKLNP